MGHSLRSSEKKVRSLTAAILLACTVVTFLQIHDPRGGLFGFHITSLGTEHLLLLMLLSLGATFILANGLYRGRRLAYELVLVLSLLFGFGALLTGPTVGTVIDTLLCATLLFALINYAFAFDIGPDLRVIRRNIIAALLITPTLWLIGARVITVTNFDPLSFEDALKHSALWLLGTPLEALGRLTALSESLLSITLVIWALYLLGTFFVIIMSADDPALVVHERAWIRKLLLRPARRR